MREYVDVVVVGGGLAGTAALATLRAQGVDALLLEKKPPLAERTFVFPAPVLWNPSRHGVTRLLESLDLVDHVVTLPADCRRRFVVRGGRLRAQQPRLRSLVVNSAIGFVERLSRAAASVVEEPRGDVRSLAWLPELAREDGPDGSAGAEAAPPRRRFRISTERLVLLRGGAERVLAAAEERLPVHTGALVEALARDSGRISMRVRQNDDSLIIKARAVVLALDAPASAPLLSSWPQLTQTLREVKQEPIAWVHWREQARGASGLPHGLGWAAPPDEGCFALGTLFVSELLGDVGPRSFATLVGGLDGNERARLTDADLGRVVAEEIQRLGGTPGEVIAVERRMIPSGVSADRLSVAEGTKSLAGDGVVLTGPLLARASAVRLLESGMEAAREVMRLLGHPAGQRPEVPATPTPSAVPMASAGSGPAPGLGRGGGAGPPRISTPPSPSPGAGSRMMAPLFVVGAGYRDSTTDVRARLASLEAGDDPPSRALLRAGYADGVVVLETCSRVEWIVSSSRPQWAVELLKSTLALRVPEARLHAKVGHAGAHYLLRLAMGLDSVAEGEPAVGRQLVLAFERCHKDGSADRVLRLSWRAVQQLLGERRRRGVVQHGLGVQTLALEELATRGVRPSEPVLVFGQGEIGRAVLAALREHGFARAEAYRRATHDEFQRAALSARAVVVCTGGPAAFLELPPRDRGALDGLVVDVGVPEQVKAAPGWQRVTLEELLQRPRRMLDEDTRTWLVEQVGIAADRLSKDLADPPPANALSAIDEERRVFLREVLPPLLEKLPQQSAEEVRKACATFAHHLMERVREGGVS